ncbi:MAG TPA: gephyrin-like molybdotransferase Glp [Polyangia bacterium]|nr:gephyrin-like molybdotransferase Glp [Polyangia bacterium]
MIPLTLIPADEARRILLETPPVGTERVPLREAGGRVLAGPLRAPEDLPSERRSVMDGYAVRAADVRAASELASVTLTLVGTVPMGDVFHGAVAAGEAVAISTGGFVPAGADAVVMVEHTSSTAESEGQGRSVEISRAVAPGTNIIEVGEDFAAGADVLPAGRRLRPQDVAALATFGVAEVSVFRRPRVAVLSTGNELSDPSSRAAPRPGQVRDANQYALAAQVEAAGCLATRGGIVRDDAGTLREAVARALAEHDAVILSGGSSVGTKDVAAEAMLGLSPPGVLFHGVDIRPGKPTLFARAGARPVVGMPGFPTSSLIVFDAFIRPMLWRLGGEFGRETWPARRRARLAKAHPSVVGREDYLRVRLVERDGTPSNLWAEALAGGSAAISNVVLADGLVRVEAAAAALAAGDPVDVLLY